MGTIQTIEEIDNTGTLYEEVLLDEYGEEADVMLVNTKFIRAYILKTIKEFVEHEDVACVKEFSTEPTMIYATDPNYNYEGIEKLTTDMVIVPNATKRITIQNILDTQEVAYPLVVEALNKIDISALSWDSHIDDLLDVYNKDEVRKVIIEDVVALLTSWNDTTAITKDMIKEYNANYDISFNSETYYQEPLDLISKKYWEKLSFILTINDYDIYNEDSTYLDIIADKYFNNGYFDEIVIKINYFYWHDNFEKIVTWSQENLKSALVSYRFDTIFSNNNKNRYYDEAEALKYNDELRPNTIEEEIEMFEVRLPIFLDAILVNPQTFGFELNGGYFGNEGFIPGVSPGNEAFDIYKDITCKTLAANPFAQHNDNISRVFADADSGRQIFFCMKIDH